MEFEIAKDPIDIQNVDIEEVKRNRKSTRSEER